MGDTYVTFSTARLVKLTALPKKVQTQLEKLKEEIKELTTCIRKTHY